MLRIARKLYRRPEKKAAGGRLLQSLAPKSPTPAPRRLPGPEETAQLLEKAAQFADHEWIQGRHARDAAGRPVAWENPAAIQFCAAGLLGRAVKQHGKEGSDSLTLRAALVDPCDERHVETLRWNDLPGRTAEEVRDLFLSSAARLRQAIAAQLQKETEAEAETET